jgi:hypothetical protein
LDELLGLPRQAALSSSGLPKEGPFSGNSFEFFGRNINSRQHMLPLRRQLVKHYAMAVLLYEGAK